MVEARETKLGLERGGSKGGGGDEQREIVFKKKRKKVECRIKRRVKRGGWLREGGRDTDIQ